MWNQILFQTFLRYFEKIHTGSLTLETPDHKTYHFKGITEGPCANIRLYDWRVISAVAAKGDIGFAEAYRESLWETDDLVALCSVAVANQDVLNPCFESGGLHYYFHQVFYLFQKNSLRGSRKNIHAHYDIGNSFYALWLDPTMTYSSALYSNDNEDLSIAQNNKYDRILNAFERDSGALLEIGCGWGGFADRAMDGHKDFDITGITLSDEQHDFAQARLMNKAKIKLEDYRHQQGKYDQIVSIEMFEAVGEKYWPVYFNKIKELLADGGKAIIQTITVDDREFENYKRRTDFIRSYIFPGGMLPSPSRFDAEARKAGLNPGNRFEFGKDYAQTLETWLQNFDDVAGKIKAMGFDEKFIRLWRFYLAACAAGFRAGFTNVQQIELSHA
jgi:cyclopropane-fatty-acyl-phospholipid synthase